MSNEVRCPMPKAHGTKTHPAGSTEAKMCAARVAKNAERRAARETKAPKVPRPSKSARPATTPASVPHRHVAEARIREHLEDFPSASMTIRMLTAELINRGIRHPDYVGSTGTAPVLARDINDLVGYPTPERLSRRLAKRGWYADPKSAPEVIRPESQRVITDEETRTQEEYLERIFTEAYWSAIDWDGLATELFQRGVGHPDFPQGVSPLGALERDIDDLRRQYGETEILQSSYVRRLVALGWFVANP